MNTDFPTEEFEARLRRGLDNIAADMAVRAPDRFDPRAVSLLNISEPRQHRRVPYFAAAAAVGLVGTGLIVAANRETPTPASPLGTAMATTNVATAGPTTTVAATTTVAGTAGPGTAGPGTAPGSIAQNSCPDNMNTMARGTLYLGGPGWEQNLAAPGFIFSLPEGTPPILVATKAVGMPFIGADCGISAMPAAPSSIAGHEVFDVTISPPAAPTAIRLQIDVLTRDGVTGVVSISGAPTVVRTPEEGPLEFAVAPDGIPSTAARLDIRFKKGDDVWFLSAPPTPDPVQLLVPAGETDRFPDAPIEWVLLTLLDGDDQVVGISGTGLLLQP